MKHKINHCIYMIPNRLAALFLCFVLLFAAVPLPQAFAAPEDEDTGVSDTSDTGEEADSNGEETESESSSSGDGHTDPGATNSDNVTAAASGAPATNAEAALPGQSGYRHGAVRKNADERRYPASTTKIMTALIVLENVTDLGAKTVTAQASDLL